MTSQIQVQRFTNRGAYYQDGMLDMAIGLTALFLGAALWSGIVFLGWIIPAALTPSWITIRKANLRRMGLDGSPATLMKQRGIILGLMAGGGLVFLGLIALFFLSSGPSETVRVWLDTYLFSALAGMSVLITLLIGLVLGLRRFYGYAGVIMLLFAARNFISLTLELGLLIFGGLVLMVGIGIMIRFLNQFPPSEDY